MMPEQDNSPTNIELKVTTGRGTGNQVKTETITWPDLVKSLSKATVDDIDHQTYLALPKEQRTQHKAQRGYYYLAESEGNVRSNEAVVSRCGVQLDVEGSNATIEQLRSVLAKWEWHAHSTRSSTDGDQRFRVILPYSQAIDDPALHKAIGDYLCDRLEQFGIDTDRKASTVLSQPAFLPTISSGQKFDQHLHKGNGLLNPITLPITYEPMQSARVVDLKDKVSITSTEIKDLLSYLTDPNLVEDYWEWIKVGQALYHQFDGSHDGLELWDEWSAHGTNYPGPQEIETKWRSFHVAGAKTVTVRSLMAMAKDRGWHDEAPPAEQVATITPGRLKLGGSGELPKRPWVLGRRLMRGYISLLSSPGGTGKSVVNLATASAVALGRDELTGEKVRERTRVWYINWEDDRDEILRRLHAIVQHHGIDPGDLEDWLFVDSWYGLKGRKLAVETEQGIRPSKVAEQIALEAKANDIGLIILDPLVALHSANENDNGAMDEVFAVLRQIAAFTNAAVLVANHTAKGSGVNSEAHAGSGDAGRGASAQRDAARFAHTLARMSHDTAERYGLEPAEARRLVRLDSAKVNFALPDAEAEWFRLESVSLLNGDEVGVPVPYDIAGLVEAAERQRDADSDRRRKEWRVQIVEAMAEDEMRQVALRDTLMAVWGVRSTQTDERIRMAVPAGKDNALRVSLMEGETLLWRELGSARNSPAKVCKEAVL